MKLVGGSRLLVRVKQHERKILPAHRPRPSPSRHAAAASRGFAVRSYAIGNLPSLYPAPAQRIRLLGRARLSAHLLSCTPDPRATASRAPFFFTARVSPGTRP